MHVLMRITAKTRPSKLVEMFGASGMMWSGGTFGALDCWLGSERERSESVCRGHVSHADVINSCVTELRCCGKVPEPSQPHRPERSSSALSDRQREWPLQWIWAHHLIIGLKWTIAPASSTPCLPNHLQPVYVYKTMMY